MRYRDITFAPDDGPTKQRSISIARLTQIESLARLASERPDFSYGMARRRLLREVKANEWWRMAAELRAWRSGSAAPELDTKE